MTTLLSWRRPMRKGPKMRLCFAPLSLLFCSALHDFLRLISGDNCFEKIHNSEDSLCFSADVLLVKYCWSGLVMMVVGRKLCWLLAGRTFTLRAALGYSRHLHGMPNAPCVQHC